jgi:hypothetical protein
LATLAPPLAIVAGEVSKSLLLLSHQTTQVCGHRLPRTTGDEDGRPKTDAIEDLDACNLNRTGQTRRLLGTQHLVGI